MFSPGTRPSLVLGATDDDEVDVAVVELGCWVAECIFSFPVLFGGKSTELMFGRVYSCLFIHDLNDLMFLIFSTRIKI